MSGRPVNEVLAGPLVIWLTEWCSEVSGLDVRLAADGGKKLLDLLWSGNEVQIRTFKRALAWAPELIGLAGEKAGTPCAERPVEGLQRVAHFGCPEPAQAPGFPGPPEVCP